MRVCLAGKPSSQEKGKARDMAGKANKNSKTTPKRRPRSIPGMNPEEAIERDLKDLLQDIEANENEREDEEVVVDQLSEHDAPLIRLVNSLLREAIRRGASDIHIALRDYAACAISR